ncbi:MAG: hypothetical protein ACRDT0_00055 [Pseudonocardiaceae bacterium]
MLSEDASASGATLLPAHLADQLEDVARVLGARRIRLFGGAAFDLVVGVREHADLDIALPGRPEMRDTCLERLRGHPEVTAVSDARQYWIRFHVPVTIVNARWGETLLDLNFLDEWDSIGHFDIERVRWDFPSCTLEDPHGVTQRPVRTVRLVTGVGQDNPILLLNRLLKLSAKYDIPFWQDAKLFPVVNELVVRAGTWASKGTFQGRNAHAAFVQTLASATRRSTDPVRFLRGCVESGVVASRLPTLARRLADDPAALQELAEAGSDDGFWSRADAVVGRTGTAWRRYRGGTR